MCLIAFSVWLIADNVSFWWVIGFAGLDLMIME